MYKLVILYKPIHYLFYVFLHFKTIRFRLTEQIGINFFWHASLTWRRKADLATNFRGHFINNRGRQTTRTKGPHIRQKTNTRELKTQTQKTQNTKHRRAAHKTKDKHKRTQKINTKEPKTRYTEGPHIRKHTKYKHTKPK